MGRMPMPRYAAQDKNNARPHCAGVRHFLRLAARGLRRLLRLAVDPGGLRQRRGPVGPLPREAAVRARLAAEVAVAGGLLVDRAEQVQVLDDPARGERERLTDQV